MCQNVMSTPAAQFLSSEVSAYRKGAYDRTYCHILPHFACKLEESGKRPGQDCSAACCLAISGGQRVPNLGSRLHIQALGQQVGEVDDAHQVVHIALDAAGHPWVLDLHGNPAAIMERRPMHLCTMKRIFRKCYHSNAPQGATHPYSAVPGIHLPGWPNMLAETFVTFSGRYSLDTFSPFIF